MRQVVTIIKAVCDWCGGDLDDESDLNTHDYTIDGQHYEIDLCPNDNSLWPNFEGFTIGQLMKNGRTVKPQRGKAKQQSKADAKINAQVYERIANKTSTGYTCPEKGCDFDSDSRNGMAVHVSRSHKKRIGDYL